MRADCVSLVPVPTPGLRQGFAGFLSMTLCCSYASSANAASASTLEALERSSRSKRSMI